MMLLQAKKLQTRLQDLDKLLAHFDCRGRFGKRHHPLKYATTGLYEGEHQREDTFPNALEDFLAFQGTTARKQEIIPRSF